MSLYCTLLTLLLPGVFVPSRLTGSIGPGCVWSWSWPLAPDNCIQPLAWTWPPSQWPCLLLCASCLKGLVRPPSRCLLPGGLASDLHGPADAPSSLPPSVSWIAEVWIVVHADYELFIISVIFIEYVVTLYRCSSVHMTSVASVHPGRGILLCCSPEGFFPFLPVKVFCSISWELFLIRCEVLGQGCRMRTDCKALRQICDLGLYKVIWVELNSITIF